MSNFFEWNQVLLTFTAPSTSKPPRKTALLVTVPSSVSNHFALPGTKTYKNGHGQISDDEKLGTQVASIPHEAFCPTACSSGNSRLHPLRHNMTTSSHPSPLFVFSVV